MTKVLVLHASGTNRDHDAAFACTLAGGQPEIVHISRLRTGARRFADFGMLVIPGGFSYADALGAGRLLALDLQAYFADEVNAFVESGRPVIGICNGFQALVKANLLPGRGHKATLTHNRQGRFECRWISLLPHDDGVCLWTQGLHEVLACPVAHGEGQFVPEDDSILAQMRSSGQIALTYCAEDGSAAAMEYPQNPNGSIADIAGVCNERGNVLGLMPHPENAVLAEQLPRWTRGQRRALGLALFENGVRYAGGA